MKSIQLIRVLGLAFLVSLFVSAGAVNPIKSTNKKGVVNSEILKFKIDSLVRCEIGNDNPGGAIGIIKDNQLFFKNCYGLSNLESAQLITENSVFNIASVSKHFTVYAILLLEEEKQLSLDDNILKYLPQFPDFGYVITIRNLIQHTSGLPSTDVLRLLGNLPFDMYWTQQNELDLIKSYNHLNFKPNAMELYSNAGYTLLAEIVEEVSGMDFSDFMKSRVFEPMSMSNSFVYDGKKKKPDQLAKGYKKENESFVLCKNNEIIYGSSNVLTSLDDLLLWGQNIFTKEVDNNKYINLISHPYNTLANGDSIQYTYGFNVMNYNGVKLVEHSGGLPGYRSQFMIFPDEKMLLTLLFNREDVNTRRLAYKIVDLLLLDKLTVAKPKKREAIEIAPELLRPFVGEYQMADGMRLGFELQQDTLRLTLPGNETFPLFAESKTNFFLKAFSAQCTFNVDENGTVNEMIWHQGGKDYKAMRVKETTPLDSEELANYAGVYHQRILKVEYPVLYQDGELVLLLPGSFKTYLGIDKVKLVHIDGDSFLCESIGVVKFIRDEVGHVNGFELVDLGRVKNIEFHLREN